MPTTHIVKAGESLSSIAVQHGFRDWQTIYNAPENAELRNKRPNPHVILIGDEVVIPDKRPKQAPVSSGKPAKFQQLPPVPQPAQIELGFFDKNDPSAAFPNLTLTLQISGQPATLVRKVDSSGVLRLEEPTVTAGAKVDVLDIRDETKDPTIRYTEFAKSGLAVNQQHLFEIPHKRKIVDRIAAKHSIQRRAAWGARPPKKAEMEQDWDFDTIVIHHSGNRGRKKPTAIQNFHMDDEDFDDIAYQYIVLSNGSIAEGRYLAHKGAANAAQNTGKLGILVAGDFEPGVLDFDDDVPTTAQLDATRNLAKTLKSEFAAPLQRLVGHRDLKDTECPGEELYVHVPGFRSATGLAP